MMMIRNTDLDLEEAVRTVKEKRDVRERFREGNKSKLKYFQNILYQLPDFLH